jgi:hypothetical protein
VYEIVRGGATEVYLMTLNLLTVAGANKNSDSSINAKSDDYKLTVKRFHMAE